MDRANVLLSRMVSAGRRVTGAPDWPLMAGVGLGVLAMIEVAMRGGRTGAALTTALLLGPCATMPLTLVRTQLLAAATTITVATALPLAVGYRPTGAAIVSLLAVAYLLGHRRSPRVALVVIAVFAGYAVAPVSERGPGGKPFAVLLLALAVAAATVGGARRARRQAADRAASQRAMADTLLEHAARGERARIARELHDVVAHHISMISVQAETARLTTPGLPAKGAERLMAIGDTARAALTEMRRLLGVLREDAETEPTRAPQPDLAQLVDLLDAARDSTAVSTRLIVSGRVAPLDPGVELTVYRIVQEALTNARRHARGAAVDVELTYTDDAIHLRVRDNGPGPPSDAAPASGHGLLGMRERATMIGGTLTTGPGPTSGFLVEAVLPTTAVPA